jgi:hypothetical protein
MPKKVKRKSPKRRPTRMEKVEMAQTGRKPKSYNKKKKKK